MVYDLRVKVAAATDVTVQQVLFKVGDNRAKKEALLNTYDAKTIFKVVAYEPPEKQAIRRWKNGSTGKCFKHAAALSQKLASVRGKHNRAETSQAVNFLQHIHIQNFVFHDARSGKTHRPF